MRKLLLRLIFTKNERNTMFNALTFYESDIIDGRFKMITRKEDLSQRIQSIIGTL